MTSHILRNITVAALFALTIMMPLYGRGKGEVSMQEEKKGLLVVSFGTSYEETLQKNIAATEDHIARAFPSYEVRRAFTSTIVQRILKGRGIEVDNVEEALAKMAGEGFTEVIIQPLHLMAGEEYHVKVLGQASRFRDRFSRFAIGYPLFAGPEDFPELIDILIDSLPPLSEGEGVVFMGHGTHHPSNASYAMLHMMFEDRGLHVYVGTVEGYPELDHIIPRLERDGISRVYLLPLMMVAGDHAQNDMAGEEEDSWLSVLTEAGFEAVPILRGLGELSGIRDIFVSRAADAMEQIN